MRHVSPEQWADAATGRLSPAVCTRIETHAAGCASCAAERARVTAARGALSDIAATPAPELSWDHIGARIY